MVDLLFRWGPGKKDGPLEPADLVNWQALTGVELTAWQAETLYRMSEAYVVEIGQAVKHDAPCPWPEGEAMWRWVQRHRAERKLDREDIIADQLEKRRKLRKEKPRNGDRQ